MAHTILCVDEDRALNELLAKALRTAGYRVVTAPDGEEALACFERNSPDLVMLDTVLPKRDGFAVLESIREFEGGGEETPVILFSGRSVTSESAERASALGASALLTKPVPLEALLTLLEQELEKREAGDEAPDSEPESDAGGELTGDFDELPFPALLHHVHGLRATGVLYVRSGKKQKAIQVRDGYPIAVKSNLVGECLGNLLVRSGRISRGPLREALRRMRGGGGLQGEILVAMDVLSEEDLSAALRMQAEEKLFEIFSWSQGRFRFAMGSRLQRASALAVDRSPATVIVRGVRERFPLAKVDAFLEAHRDHQLARGESPFYRFQEIDLDPAAQALVEEIEEPARLGDLIGGDEALRRALYGLVATGVLELRAEPRPASASASEVPAATPSLPEGREAPAESPSLSAESVVVRPLPASTGNAQEDLQRQSLAAMAERFSRANYYQILGVPPKASHGQIQQAYERLAQRTHPDRYAHASAAVRSLAERVYGRVDTAFRVLRDPRRRGRHEKGRAGEDPCPTSEQERRSLDGELAFQGGELKLQQRDYEEALRLFGRALELNPDDGEHHAHYGWALHLCHPSDAAMTEEAIEHIRRGLRLARDREKPYLFLGRLYKAVGQNAHAERMFTRALQLNPDCVDALRELRLIRMRKQREKGILRRLFGR